MLLVKGNGGGKRTLHCLPQIMRASDKLRLDLDTHTHSLHPANALHTLLPYSNITTAQDHTNLARLCYACY